MPHPIKVDQSNEGSYHHRINGTINFNREVIDDVEYIHCEWVGGDIVAISGVFIEELFASDNYYTNGWLKTGVRCRKIRNHLTIGNYQLRIISYYPSTDTYLAKRI
jgi:hypothetical protein